MLIMTILFLACSKTDKSTDQASKKYVPSDVRNRHLKTAIEDLNNDFYKAALTSIQEARGQNLRDEDIDILHDLEKIIEDKTKSAIKSLDSLATKEKLHLYDFKYNTVSKNYDISSFRAELEKTNKKYLERVKTENDAHLKNYYTLIQELKKTTEVKNLSNATGYYSQTSHLRLAVIIEGYQAPQLMLDFYPSQKEPELETLEFVASNSQVFFAKSSMLISDYNLSPSKVITFDLLKNDEKINLANFQEMLQAGKLTIKLKWFYEPETLTIPANTIKELLDVLKQYNNIAGEYRANIDKIYVPKHVK